MTNVRWVEVLVGGRGKSEKYEYLRGICGSLALGVTKREINVKKWEDGMERKWEMCKKENYQRGTWKVSGHLGRIRDVFEI